MAEQSGKRDPIPATKISVSKDGRIVEFQDYMDWNCQIVSGMNIRHTPGAEEPGRQWRLFMVDPGHGGGLDGRGATLKGALQTAGLHPSLHRRYERLFEIKHVTRSAVAKVLGGKAANYEIIRV